MKRKEKISVKTHYFILGILVGTLIIPKITKSSFGCNNGNNYFITIKKDNHQ